MLSTVLVIRPLQPIEQFGVYLGNGGEADLHGHSVVDFGGHEAAAGFLSSRRKARSSRFQVVTSSPLRS